MDSSSRRLPAALWLGPWPSVVAATAVAGAAVLPWAASGAVSRSGYALARAVRTTGLADGAAPRMVTTGVLLLPLLASLTWIGAVLARSALVAPAALAAGVLSVAGGVLVLTTDGIDAEPGAAAAVMAGAVAALASACLSWPMLRRAGRRERQG